MFAKINLCSFVGLCFLFCLMVASTFGQGLITYSDTWADTETGLADNPENNQLFIVGSAVVEIDPKSGYHSVDTQVTMTSPQGRTATGSGTWTQKSEGTSITVEVPIEATQETGIEAGNYQSLVIHIPTCPESHPPIGGGENFPVGITYLKMGLQNCDQYGCYYQRVEPCDVYCRTMFKHLVPARLGFWGNYIAHEIPYGPLGCLIFVRVHKNSTPVCYDVGWN